MRSGFYTTNGRYLGHTSQGLAHFKIVGAIADETGITGWLPDEHDEADEDQSSPQDR